MRITIGESFAFPGESEYGLTKRELFAAMAMLGILSSRGLQEALNEDREKWEWYAVQTADALIAELNKEVQS